MDIVEKAREYAMKHHAGQHDDTGAPYFYHLVQVVNILSQVTEDPDILAAGYLHDTIEDTDITYVDLVQEFGSRIADLVFEVTKNNEGRFPELHTREAILIKFADRLSNLSRMETWSNERKNQYLASSKFWKS